MATDRDDAVARRYRELAREEPGGHLDAAILAASRRAVGARPGGVRRWAGPVSIAAVLVLGVGVSLRMQLEQPGIESSPPQSPPPQVQPALPEEKAEPMATPPAPASKPAASEPEVNLLAKQRRQPEAFRTQEAPASIASPRVAAPMPQSPPAPAAAPEPAPQRSAAPATAADSVAQPAAAGAPAASLAPAAPPAALRAKREERSVGSPAASENAARRANVAEDPATELERIARLRAEGHDAEADRALDEFRRRHPDYRIPEATWERVKPRTP